MKNETIIKQKLSQISALISDIESLMGSSHTAGYNQYLLDEYSVKASYDFNAVATRWVTCADLCAEQGIQPTRANCSSMGSIMKRSGIATRRSQGRKLLNMPPMIEKF